MTAQGEALAAILKQPENDGDQSNLGYFPFTLSLSPNADNRMCGPKPALFTNEHSGTKVNAFRAQQIRFCRGMLQLQTAAMAGSLHLN